MANLSFLSPVRTVLLIGDDSLYVFKVQARATKLVEEVPWDTQGFIEIVTGLIKNECGGKPVLVLNDMTDQHFKGGQRLPKVGVMDKASVLKRKIQVAFPNYPIRGALAIKAPSEGQKRRLGSQDMYLFAAVPMSEPITKTMEAVRQSLAPIAGFYLLPVESSDLVRKLAEAVAGKKSKPSKWTIFLGQHRSGALRQVIIRDGQLAMTRMTPISEDQKNQVWASEVNQELKATLSYLSRFGYSADDSTDIIVIADPQAGKALEGLLDIPCQYTTFTAPEAARKLGMPIGMQESPHYADVLHAAWAGRKTRFILPMKAEEIDKVHQPRQIAALAMVLLVLGAGYLGWQLSSEAQSFFTARSELATQKDLLKKATAEYEEEVARMEALGFDVKLVQGSIGTFEDLEDRRLKTLDFVQKVDKAVGDELRLDAFEISYSTKGLGTNTRSQNAAEASPLVHVALRMSFPRTIRPEVGVREVNNFSRRLQAVFPDYKVDIRKNVGATEFSDELSGTAGRTAEEIAEDEMVAEIVIDGEVK